MKASSPPVQRLRRQVALRPASPPSTALASSSCRAAAAGDRGRRHGCSSTTSRSSSGASYSYGFCRSKVTGATGGLAAGADGADEAGRSGRRSRGVSPRRAGDRGSAGARERESRRRSGRRGRHVRRECRGAPAAGSCSLDASGGFAAGASTSCDTAICFCRPTPSTSRAATIASADAADDEPDTTRPRAPTRPARRFDAARDPARLCARRRRRRRDARRARVVELGGRPDLALGERRERLHQRPGRRRARRRIGGQRARDDRQETDRQLGRDRLQRHRGLRGDVVQDRVVRLARVRLPPRAELVEDRPQRVDVGALVDDLVAAGLLRRHVRDGPDHRAGARRRVHLVERLQLGDPEVEHLQEIGPVLPPADEQILRLEVAVDDPRGVRDLDPAGRPATPDRRRARPAAAPRVPGARSGSRRPGTPSRCRARRPRRCRSRPRPPRARSPAPRPPRPRAETASGCRAARRDRDA